MFNSLVVLLPVDRPEVQGEVLLHDAPQLRAPVARVRGLRPDKHLLAGLLRVELARHDLAARVDVLAEPGGGEERT